MDATKAAFSPSSYHVCLRGEVWWTSATRRAEGLCAQVTTFPGLNKPTRAESGAPGPTPTPTPTNNMQSPKQNFTCSVERLPSISQSLKEEFFVFTGDFFFVFAVNQYRCNPKTTSLFTKSILPMSLPQYLAGQRSVFAVICATQKRI